jgi:hypothetical protein
MRTTILFILAASVFLAPPVHGQTPYVTVFFDESYEQTGIIPPGPLVFDTLYVVAGNFDMLASSIEYRVEQNPDYFVLVMDLVDIGTIEGSSYSGIRIHYDPPLNATNTILVERIQVIWNWVGVCQFANVPLRIFPHPESGKIQAIRSPDLVPVEAVGQTAYICPTVPVEETSWGRIKGLYER